MRILCITGDYISLPSNELMNSTVFHGMTKNNFEIDLVTFKNHSDISYSHFRQIYHIKGKKKYATWLKDTFLRMPYLLWINIIGYYLIRPYRKEQLNSIDLNQYNLILSFCPPPLSSLIASDIIKNSGNKIKIVQYWSDPLTIGMLDNFDRIPIKRIFHKIVEKKILNLADEIVYCSPVLCEAQKIVFPQFSHKMRWTDVGLIDRKKSLDNKTKNNIIKIGYFGSYYCKIRNIRPLLDSFTSFKNANLIVRGDTDLRINELILPSSIDIKTGRLPYKEIEDMELDTDILICLGNISGIQIPGKLFYYANLEKPVIYIGDGVHNNKISKYLSELDRFILCDNNIESINIAINKAIDELSDFKLNINKRLLPEDTARNIVIK